MLINNKLKQGLCGQSYGSNSDRKQLFIHIEEIDKEMSKCNPKKKSKPLYEIGDIVTVSSLKIKDGRKLYDKLDMGGLHRWIGKITLQITGLKPTKTKKNYYIGTILEMIPEYSKHVDTSILIGEVVKFIV